MLFFSLLSIRRFRQVSKRALDEAQLLNFTKQFIDHQDASKGYFTQRYYEVKPNNSTTKYAILDIGGESDSFYPSGVDDFYEVLSQDLENATVLTLEHRFFGKSLPADNLKYETYKQLLNVDQAVQDLITFKKWYQNTYLSNDTKWLLIGGSYAGMLSAITRSSYPKEFAAALSSSGVVLASDDFGDFDRQIEISLGHECATQARIARRHIDYLLDNGQEDYVLNLFNAKNVTADVFRFVVGEMFSLSPQYGQRELVCGPLENTIITGEDPMMALAKFSREVFAADQSIYEMYANDYLKDDQNTEHPAARSWQWMTCNELAYWQVAPGKTTLRSPKVTQDFFYNQCKEVFDQNIPWPSVDDFNKKWGGLQQNGTKIFYTTGSQDPWTHLCITEEQIPDGCYAHTIIGPNSGHCSDLHGATSTDPIDLIKTRQAIRDAMKQWLMSN